MSERSDTPASPNLPKKKPAHRSALALAAYSLALLGAVAGTACFGYLLLRGPEAKPMPDLAPRKKDAPASSTILGKSAALPPEEPKPQQATLAQIAKLEAAKQAVPGGPLYDARSSNVMLKFEELPKDSPQVDEAQAVLTKYLQAASWRDRLPFVFEPERVEPLMQEQYEKRQQPDPERGPLVATALITAGTSQVINLQFACSTRPDCGLRANFHRTRAGKLLLDWESWVAWSERSWPQLKQERSQAEVVMRAIASESDYYNYEFAEKWRWLAVKLRSPDGLYNVTGYVDRASVLGVAMANLIGVPLPSALPEGTPMPPLKLPGSKALVTVRLSFPSHAQSDHCVNLHSLLADRWMLFPEERK